MRTFVRGRRLRLDLHDHTCLLCKATHTFCEKVKFFSKALMLCLRRFISDLIDKRVYYLGQALQRLQCSSRSTYEIKYF